MITVRDGDTGQLLGAISDEEAQFLAHELEAESLEDADFYIDAGTIDMLEADGAGASLVAFLRKALGAREGMEISWERD